MQRLTDERVSKGFTKRELAKLIGIKEARYGHYENGKRKLPVEIAKRIGEVLEIDWKDLYD
ncbi:MAG: helix-turn-helix transcriptional regulator [Tissierellia bacterium]|nr:helix-turn-helix transcriptional regulator [Tissierellia bacterium]